MKKIYIFLLSVIAVFYSCSLDKYPETTFTDNSFWVSEEDLRSACNRLYWEHNDKTFRYDFRADDIFDGSGSGNTTSNGQRMTTARSDDWKDPYSYIAVANNIISKGLDEENFQSVTEKVLNRYLAEAYFFRASNYFTLVSKYGDVPLILTPIKDVDDPVLKLPRNPREEVVKQIYEDLDFAAQHLPVHSAISDADWGRVSRSSALAMKARIALYEGTRSKFHNDGRDYKSHLSKAVEAAGTIIEEKQHSLYTNGYDKLFLYEAEGKQNKENVYVKVYGISYDNKVKTYPNRHEYIGITRKMVDMYLCADGLPWGVSPYTIPVENQSTYNEIFQNRDPRMSLTLYQIGETAYKGEFNVGNTLGGTGYSMKKMFVREDYDNKGSVLDIMVIRYAEVLLIYAEATYELNESISDEILDNTINELRRRVGFDVELTNEFVTNNSLNMRDEIRRERTVELAFENHRYNDLMRWKTAETELPEPIVGTKYTTPEEFGGKPESDYANILDEKKQIIVEKNRTFRPERDYLYPIPTTDIYLSDDKITQNPNW